MKTEYSDLDMRLAKRIYSDLKKLNHRFSEPKLEKWADDIRLICKIKKCDHLYVYGVWAWAHNDEFWKLNILSPGKLRKQFDQLVIRKEAADKKTNKSKQIKKTIKCRSCNRVYGVDFHVLFGDGQCVDCYKKL